MSRSRQLAAIMFTDIEGYTALMQQNEAQAIQVREKHRRIFNALTEKYRGRILQYYGDGTLSIFDSAIDATNCGIDLQLAFMQAPAIPVRIGIHTGDIIFSEEEIIGDSVNVASRIESLAVPGSVLISDKVYDEIKNQSSIEATLLKTVKLKNIDKPMEVYALSNPGLTVPLPEDIRGKTDPNFPDQTVPKPIEESPQREFPALILATKLYIPPHRAGAVHRPRLIKRLQAGLRGKLTLISAPAGFGKTTLISEWVSQIGKSDLRYTSLNLRGADSDLRSTNSDLRNAGLNYTVAWLSLDEGDQTLTRFLTYLVASLQTVAPQIGAEALGMLTSPQPASTASILTVLLNEIAGLTRPCVLVLDDYHLIDAHEIDEALTFLLDHLPPQLHLLITTREDPNLPLARLRVRGKLTEIRVEDLRFSPEEVAEFLNQAMGLNLSPENIAALEARTEGWIAGLQMAALSIEGRTDSSGFIQAFTGSHHFILDYLVEEVLQQQPESIRNFLLQTAILDRLSGSLCDAVAEGKESQKVLESLERGNLFLVPLDQERKWYRYHHLFAEMLRARVGTEQTTAIEVLHTRASIWYAQQNQSADAIRHALAAMDFEGAAGLIECAWPEMDHQFQTQTWQSWVMALPSEVVNMRPVLNLNYAWALLNHGELEPAAARLKVAEVSLKKIEGKHNITEFPKFGVVVTDEEQFHNAPASIATARSYLAQAQGDWPGSVLYGRQALDQYESDDHLRRGPAAALLGLAHWANGELEAAFQSIADAMLNFQLAGNLLFAISGTYGMADIRMAQGRMREALRVYEKALKLVQEQSDTVLLGTSDIYSGLAAIHLEFGEKEASISYLQQSEELGTAHALPDWPFRLHLLKASIQESQGNWDETLDLLEEAERLYYPTPVPMVRPIPAMKVRVWLRQGKLAEAQGWLRKSGVSTDDDLHFLREFEHLTLARILLYQYEQDRNPETIESAIHLLTRLLAAAETEERGGSVISILLLQALAYSAQDHETQAVASLTQALNLAAPEGYLITFVLEGKPMAQLLSNLAAQGIMPDYVQQILAAFPDAQAAPVSVASHLISQPLVEPLSQRELEILALISKGYSNQEISDRLFLALSTIKGHNRNIFGKLGVQRRTEAVARARELGLLG